MKPRGPGRIVGVNISPHARHVMSKDVKRQCVQVVNHSGDVVGALVHAGPCESTTVSIAASTGARRHVKITAQRAPLQHAGRHKGKNSILSL